MPEHGQDSSASIGTVSKRWVCEVGTTSGGRENPWYGITRERARETQSQERWRAREDRSNESGADGQIETSMRAAASGTDTEYAQMNRTSHRLLVTVASRWRINSRGELKWRVRARPCRCIRTQSHGESLQCPRDPASAASHKG